MPSPQLPCIKRVSRDDRLVKRKAIKDKRHGGIDSESYIDKAKQRVDLYWSLSGERASRHSPDRDEEVSYWCYFTDRIRVSWRLQQGERGIS